MMMMMNSGDAMQNNGHNRQKTLAVNKLLGFASFKCFKLMKSGVKEIKATAKI